MPGYLGGSTSGGSGTGGEISFPKEFIDPVTKLRVSQPENLIDTDFEYGLQPTKWETVELINNTPSFFSKNGDTTIPNIISITTNAGTREITVVSGLEHGVSVGIPIQVTGTKSVTADGSYIINSIPNTTTFTYLCRANQPNTSSIEDLYSSIITGEFFQGSQLRVADASGIVTNNAEGTSTLTVTTESAHGFKINTPFYFLNLNSTISKDFQASNTAAKSFDSTNSAVAQTFDGSNTLSSINVDWSNSASVGGATSTVSGVSTVNNTITVTHGTENFVGRSLGTPLYYAITGGAGYFATNPRGVVFLKSIGNLGAGTSTFEVSAIPDGNVIPITAALSGTFQLANQARTFAGNNINPITQTNLTIIKESEVAFDGGNQGYAGAVTNGACVVEGYSGTILVSTTAGAGLDYYVGAMVRYSTTGSAASGLVNNRTYFIASYVASATPNQYRITIKELPTDGSALAPTGGSGDQTFTKIGVSPDKDIVHIKNASFSLRDMIEYTFPVGGRFTAATAEQTKIFYFVEKAYDAHNYELAESANSFINAVGGVTSEVTIRGAIYRTHTFASSGTFTVANAPSPANVEYLVVAGGGSGGSSFGGGGGAGGFIQGTTTVTATDYTIVVGAGGARSAAADSTRGNNGQNSTAFGLTALGGGGGGAYIGNNGSSPGISGGSGGGGGSSESDQFHAGGSATQSGPGFGFAGGAGRGRGGYLGAGGGGAGGVGGDAVTNVKSGDAGIGRQSLISGSAVYYAGGGGGAAYIYSTNSTIDGYATLGGGPRGRSEISSAPGFNAPANLGAGGGGGGFPTGGGGAGGSGVVIIRYPITSTAAIATVAAGGSITSTTVGDTTYRVHSFTAVGSSTLNVTLAGNLGPAEYLIVGGGGGGGNRHAGGGGGGGFVTGIVNLGVSAYPIVVGSGGQEPTYIGGALGISGSNSSAFGITAIGGGGGGAVGQTTRGSVTVSPGGAGIPGGSGGGGGENSGGAPGGAGTTGQGFAGGRGNLNNTWAGGGGGGGAGGVGTDAELRGTVSGGRGGPGAASNITGSLIYYSGGGGGSCYGNSQDTGSGVKNHGAGGIGGGGAGGTVEGVAGTNGLGGGGGGGSSNGDSTGKGGSGGSGIVIVRYPISITGII